MRVMMISGADLSSKESLGVTKKIMGQYHAFQNLGCDVYNLCLDSGQGVILHGNEKTVLFSQQAKEYFAYIKLFGTATQLCKKYQIELCYIRYMLADWVFMRMLRKLHKLCKVVVEIPTYPYDKQNEKYKNIIAKANYFQDKHFRNQMKRYVDYISTFSDDKTIYGIPCVNISNGIDVSQIRYLGNQLNYQEDIHLIGVARIQRDHGYDRIIEGMREYYRNKKISHRNIYFHIVGNGEAEDELKRMVKEYALEERVFFYGVKSGKDLESIYLHSNIGVGLLAGYRSGHNSRSALKNKEYCAIGLPFIGSTYDSSIHSDVAWYRLFENSESLLNMEDIVVFFEYIKAHSEVHGQMRKMAENKFTWEQQVNKIIQYVI